MGKKSPISKTSLMTVGTSIHEGMSVALQKIEPDQRRPLSIGGRTIDLSEVETLGRSGLDENLALKLLKIPMSAMEDEPEAAQTLREQLDYGLAQLSQAVQEASIKKAVVDGDATMLKFIAGAYGARQLQDKKNQATGSMSDADQILKGLLKTFIDERNITLDQQRRTIAEERARMDAGSTKSQPPVLGDVKYRQGIPACEVEIPGELEAVEAGTGD